MKQRISTRALFMLGVGLVIAANGIVLAGAAFNRKTPEATVTLTERELKLPHFISKEDSGIALRLFWRVFRDEDGYPSRWGSPDWLDTGKLKALGIDVPDADDDKEVVSKKVYLVLEYDGDAYQKSLALAKENITAAKASLSSASRDKEKQERYERKVKFLEEETRQNSRLFVIDAGLDRRELRRRYTDRNRFIIVKGLVEPRWSYHEKKQILRGNVQPLMTRIHVPLRHRRALEPFIGKDGTDIPPRYLVKLAYGRRLEPWVVSIRPTTPVGD